MIESIIATNHHYYVFFFESPKIKSLKSIPKLFDFESDYKIRYSENKKEYEFMHLQLELNRMYSSGEDFLQINKSKRRSNTPWYWYDFYIGKINISKKEYYYICYPYNQLGKFLENCLNLKSVQATFYKPELSQVLDYMKDRTNRDLSEVETNGLTADITRYSAEIKEELNKVNIIGQNPLKSETYKTLSKYLGTKIETVSLKLRCNKINTGNIELAFDKLGNYRFWLKRFAQDTTIPTIPYAFQFLIEVAPLTATNFISQNTLLENE